MQKYKPITFRGLNDIASDVEDVNDVAEDGDDDDRCLAEKTQTNSLMCSDRCVENLSNESNICGDALSSGNEQIPCHVEPVFIDLSSQDVPASSSEEETFSNITFETPQAEKSSQHDSSESTSDADVCKSANSRSSSRADTSVSSTKDSAEESISHSPSLLQERSKSSEPKSGAFGRCQRRYEFPTVLTSPHHSLPSEQLTQPSATDPLTPSPSSPSLLQERNKSSEPKQGSFGHCRRHYELPTVLTSPHHSLPSEQLTQPSATDPLTPSPISYSPSSPSLLQERNKSSEPKLGAFGRCQRRYEFPTVLTSPHHSSPSEQLTQPSATDPLTPSPSSPSLLHERNKSSEPKLGAFGRCQRRYEFPTVLTSPHHSSPSEQLTQPSATDPLTPSPSSPSLLHERNKSSEPKQGSFGHCRRHYELPTVLTSPHHSSPSEQLTQPSATDPLTPSSGLSPSFTRNPLHILVSSFSNTDCSARSTEQFRLEFFDRAEGIRDVATKKKAPQSDNVILVIPDSCQTSETCSKRSPIAKRCKMPLDSPQTSPVKNIPNDDDRRQFLEDLAEDTPESQQGLTCRMKQVRNRPKILSLVTRATRKIEGDHPS